MVSDKTLILCSNSPRRRELLNGLGIDFIVDTGSNFDESITPENIAPEELPQILAKGKSLGFHRPLEEDEILLTADTLVICDGRIMGKPANEQEAREMLRFLSGKTHKVVSALCLRTSAGIREASDTALVTFKDLSEEEITYYINRYKPFDKAGAYGIQEWIGYIGIPGINGSFYTVMGLPIHLVYQLLQ